MMSIVLLNCFGGRFLIRCRFTVPALISAEILARATRQGCRITQPGVHHYPRTAGVQTGAKLSVIIRAFKELFKLRRRILKDDKNAAGNA